MIVAPVRKSDRRDALEAPYRRDNERSLMEAMERGRMPDNLPGLVAWFRARLADEIPLDIHRPGVWRDHGEHAQGGSALGSPPFSDPFRRLIENSSRETDEDGRYVRPLRATLARMERRHPITSRHLYRLALMDGDWRRHAENVGWQHEEMEVFLTRALQMCWREYSDKVVSL